MPNRLLIPLVLICLFHIYRVQDSLTTADTGINFRSSLFAKVHKQTAAIEVRLTRQTENHLKHLARHKKSCNGINI